MNQAVQYLTGTSEQADTPQNAAMSYFTGQQATPQQSQKTPQQTAMEYFGVQSNGFFSQPAELTQHYGNDNPDVEVFSGGKALDTNYATPENTPLTSPNGNWQVVSTYDQASPNGGHVGNDEGEGWGNYVVLKDLNNNHTLRLAHLASVNVKAGDMFQGGTPLGTTGNSGNTTGANLGVEWMDENGNRGDISQSPYSAFFPTK